eukprot:TRINITY_DN4727_c0_g1_i1.p1 TRINITY_DN4727_c0_g1~~TRINITY_DN4727_c0_g1_i1.p1  ORF type:complete len:1030 (+),score=203.21 TRINITY_DN4727_c0_g1_i1:151-3240(+)
MEEFEFFEDDCDSTDMFVLPTAAPFTESEPQEPVPEEQPVKGKKPRQPRTPQDPDAKRIQKEERRKNKKVVIPSKAIWQVLFEDASEIEEDRKIGQVMIDDCCMAVALPKTLSKALLGHQRSAVKILWNSLFVRPKAESDEIATSIVPTSGGILAHQIGAGKTFTSIAVVALFHLVHRQHYFSSFTSSEDTAALSHSIVVVPAALQRTWLNEWTTWLGYTGLIDALDGEESRGTTERSRKEAGLYKYRESHQYSRWQRCGGCLLISYDTFLHAIRKEGSSPINKAHALLTLPKLALFDEGHGRLYEGTTTRVALNHIKTRGRIIISGTPLQNHLHDVYSLVDFVRPGYFQKEQFEELAAKIKAGRFTPDEKKKKHSVMTNYVMQSYLRSFISIRKCKNSMKGIPELTDYVITVPLTVRQLRIYHRIQQVVSGDRLVSYWSVIHMLTRLVNNDSITLGGGSEATQEAEVVGSDDDSDDDLEDDQINKKELIETIKLKIEQLPPDDQPDPESERDLPEGATEVARALGPDPAKGKLTTMVILDAVANDEKVLVFSSWVSVVTEASKSLEKSNPNIRQALITGSVPNNTRDKILKTFQDGGTSVLFLTLGTCGTGLNLQAASRVVLLDGSWNPQKLTQAIGRAYRLGQERPVQCVRFVARGSFEEQIAKVTIAKTWLKRRMMDSIYDKTQNFEDCESSLSLMCSLDCLNIPTSASERARNEANAARTPMLKTMIDSGCVVSTMNFYDFFKEESRGLTIEQKQAALSSAPARRGRPYGVPRKLQPEIALIEDVSDVEFEEKDRNKSKKASEEIDLCKTLQEMIPVNESVRVKKIFGEDAIDCDDSPDDFAILDDLLPPEHDSPSLLPVKEEFCTSHSSAQQVKEEFHTSNRTSQPKPSSAQVPSRLESNPTLIPVKKEPCSPKDEPSPSRLEQKRVPTPLNEKHSSTDTGIKRRKEEKHVVADEGSSNIKKEGRSQDLCETMKLTIAQPSSSWVGRRYTRRELNERYMRIAIADARRVLSDANNQFFSHPRYI